MKKETYSFFCVAIILIFSLFSIITKAQIVDTIFTTTGRITSIELIKTNPGKILIGNMGTTVSLSRDYGQTWMESQFDSLRPGCYDISFNQINPQIGFMVGGTSLYKTTDGGYNWFNTSTLEFIYLVDVNPIAPNIIFAQKAGDSGYGPYNLYRSADYGETWRDSLIDYWILDLQFHPTNDSIAYGYNSGNILKTTDLGKSWQAILTSDSKSFTAMAVSKSHPGTLYSCKDGLLYKTTDDGNNWSSKVIPPTGIRSILLDETNQERVYVGSKEGLFLTEDDGAQWKQIHYQGIYLIKADNEIPRNIYCTTNYERTAIKFIDTFNVTGINEPDNIQPERFFLYQNYPNPFSKEAGGNSKTEIKFSISSFNTQTRNKSGGSSELQRVILTVYDILGRRVATLINEKLSPGEYEVTFDGSGLTSGIYFYRLQAGAYSKTKKMVLTR